jgi:hypothetical protein
LKAVAMGMVTARALFWSNKLNPAMQLTENMDIKPKILHFGVGMPD